MSSVAPLFYEFSSLLGSEVAYWSRVHSISKAVSECGLGLSGVSDDDLAFLAHCLDTELQDRNITEVEIDDNPF